MAWRKELIDGTMHYVRGRYRIQRHEVDDRWDTGALVPFSIQWIREERREDGSWTPVEIHDRLADAKIAAERQEPLA
jgi:hypothetical protein